jgi:hypothetical protein
MSLTIRACSRQAAVSLGITDVERAVTVIDGDSNLGIGFGQRTAVGPTNAVFPLGALMRALVPLISNLDDEERAALCATPELRSLGE